MCRFHGASGEGLYPSARLYTNDGAPPCHGSVSRMTPSQKSGESLRHPVYKKPELLARDQRGLVVGHHEIDGAGEMGALLPLLHRHLVRGR